MTILTQVVLLTISWTVSYWSYSNYQGEVLTDVSDTIQYESSKFS